MRREASRLYPSIAVQAPIGQLRLAEAAAAALSERKSLRVIEVFLDLSLTGLAARCWCPLFTSNLTDIIGGAMKRRSLVAATSALPLALAQSPAQTAPKHQESSYIELRYFRLRNTRENQRQRVVDFIKNAYLPVALRNGLGPVGVFSSLIAPETPFILTARSYGSLYAMEQAWEKIGADAEYQKAAQAFQALPGLSYMRVETQLLRAFEGFPKVVAPPIDEKKPVRVFELRTYEANNWGALRKKIGMFDTMGEIRIFKKTGLTPVFFGETVFGPNQPSLTYMLAYDDLAARERNWRAFASDPEWLKLRATEGYSDAEVVSNISNIMFSALPFSQIR